jgi:hypothetical protein
MEVSSTGDVFDRQFKVLSKTGMSSTWRPLRIGVPQGLPSAPLLFNLYINATWEELNFRSNGSYTYADDNTLRYHTRHKESKPEFVSRMRRVVVSVEKGYENIKGVLSKEKSALLPVLHRIEEANIGSIPVLNCHKTLGVLIENKTRFHQNSVEVLIKCLRRGLTSLTGRASSNEIDQSLMRCVPTQDGICKDERLEMETKPNFGRATFQPHLSSVQESSGNCDSSFPTTSKH